MAGPPPSRVEPIDGPGRPRGVRIRRALTATGALAFVCLALGTAPGVLPATPAAASCVGPQLAIGSDPAAAEPTAQESPAPVPVPVGGPLQVSGQWFHDGCDDTGAGGAGCAGPITTSQSPLQDVDLVLTQGGVPWTLGTADAAGRAERYAIGWEVELPDDVAPGPAVLTAAGTEVAVQVGG